MRRLFLLPLILICIQGFRGAGVLALQTRSAQPRPATGVAVTVLRPHGFEPAEMEVNAGRTLLAVYNRTGAQEIFLRIEREAGSGQPGQFLREERVPIGKRATRELFDLVPGRYVVTEANHPEWKCRITVKPGSN
jgi:hypothetical protein